MPTIEITDQGLQRLQTLDPQSGEARFLSALEELGPSPSEQLLQGVNPQQQQRIVQSFTEAGLIEVSEEAETVPTPQQPTPPQEAPPRDLVGPIDLSTGFELRIPEISTGAEVRIPDISISDNGNIVGEFVGIDSSIRSPQTQQTPQAPPRRPTAPTELNGDELERRLEERQ